MPDVWFIRHGESRANAGEVAVDRGSTLLTAQGEEQAKVASLRVTERPDLIVVTPYIRTQQTAQPLRDRYPDVPCETWDLYEFSALAEKNYIGKTWMERTPMMRAYWERNDPESVDGFGAESFSAMTGRISNALARLYTRPEKFIVVYAHGYIIQTLRIMIGMPDISQKALMKSIPYYMEHSPIDNCAITRIEMDELGMTIHEEDFKSLDAAHAFEGN